MRTIRSHYERGVAYILVYSNYILSYSTSLQVPEMPRRALVLTVLASEQCYSDRTHSFVGYGRIASNAICTKPDSSSIKIRNRDVIDAANRISFVYLFIDSRL